jgi:hypothetical protein
MALEYEAALRIVRDSIGTVDIEGNPATFDPPPWAVRAVERAYKLGHGDGAQWQRGKDAGLYPEGG